MNITREKFIELLDHLEKDYNRYLTIIKNLYGRFRIDASELFDDANGWDTAIEAIAAAANVEAEDIAWFVYDNEFGKKELECSYGDSPMMPIKNANDYYDFLSLAYAGENSPIEKIAVSAIHVINQLSNDWESSCEYCVHCPEGGDGKCPIDRGDYGDNGNCGFKSRIEAMYEMWKRGELK